MNDANNVARGSSSHFGLLPLLFLILTIISILPLTISQNNNIANAQQNNVLYASLPTNNSSAINTTPSNNTNYKDNTPAVPASISLPLSRGYVNGKIAYFITTDASDNSTAIEISHNLKFKVNFAPSLAFIPQSSRQQGYEFLNGVRGQGAFGFQLPIASKLPFDKDYSPIVQLNFVKWNSNSNNNTSSTARELKSAAEIMDAQKNGELSIAKTNILVNSPAVLPDP
jgi:hypothetical protein